MNLFISDAFAQAPGAPGAAPGGSPLGFWLIMGVFFIFMYVVMIRPQQKRAKDHKAMIAALAKGDEVVTVGGTLGRITDLGESVVAIEIAPGVEMKVQRQAIQTVLPKGTIKSSDGK